MPINTVAELRAHISLATKVELSTIPPYLYAMYSIQDRQSEASRLIASVVVEEMLHAALTTNLLLAVGGEPDFGAAAVPSHPGFLAHHKPPLRLELRRCSLEVVRNTFMTIERPQAAGAIPEDDDFETLGQFYAALEVALAELDATHPLFADHQPHRQLADPSFYAPVAFDAADSGGLMLISDLNSANRALEVIIHQGEGVGTARWADPLHLELTHFHKFAQIADGLVPLGPVWPMADNPRAADFPADLRPVSDLFNALYALTFLTMADLFSGTVDQKARIGRLYALMSQCLTPTGRYLAAQPLTATTTAGPTFEVYDLGADPWPTAYGVAAAAAEHHPGLAGVAAALARYAAG
ncbi:MAG TPA: hypothetical protein DCY40_09330 [Actinobacteria bacterium]|nr:hypothetical protein [Actinomycetota bacterium]